jgi:tRNA (adenine57-N1/adenine58-N1)-methyltransferase
VTTAPFAAGDVCLLVDGKGRKYLLTLDPAREFQYHRGILAHAAIIGQPDGAVLESSMGSRLIALRPRLADYVLKMGRGAAVTYPKDAAAVVTWADIGPGMTVLEAGTGSGALTLALLRAVGASGRVVSCEQRDDHAAKARELISGFLGELPANLELQAGPVEEAIARVAADRLVLDLPEPWHSVDPAVAHLRSGAIFCCYLPTVPQVQEVVRALRAARRFIDIDTFEVLHRPWVIEGRSVRPSHRMQGHTGFITTARLVAELTAAG